MPIRLWSTVVSHDAIFPSRQSYGRRSVSVPATTSTARLRDLLRVRDQRVDLVRAPVAPDGGHQVLAVAQQRREPFPVGEQRVPAERRPDELLVEAVARRADALPLLLAEVVR